MQQVSDWLEKLGLGQYAQRFAENDISFAVLSDLTDQHLKEIGVSLGHRLQLLRAIAELTRKHGPKAAIAPVSSEATTQIVAKSFEPAGERRHVTVMFCDLVDSTGIAARLDAEEWRDLVGAYLDAASAAVTDMGGKVAKKLGDGLMALFGYPMAQENDAERAVRAGFSIQRALAELNRRNEGSGKPALAARIAIDTGPVVIDAAGEVFGDVPNIAARAQALAEPASVVVTARVQRQVAGLFVAEESGSHELKGVPEPVTLYRIVRASGGGRRAGQRHLTPLVGREEELSMLMRRWERARQGDGQLALIVGEPGLGKSRLIEEFHARLRETPHTWAEWTCSQLLQNTPLHPIAELGRQRFGGAEVPAERRFADLESALVQVKLDPAENIPLLAPLLDIPLPQERGSTLAPKELRRRQLAALTNWVLAGARVQPVVLAFEDLHWADPTTLDLLRGIAERGALAPLFVLMAARSEFRPPWNMRSHHMTISLAPLDRQQVRDMVGELAARHALSKEVVEIVTERSGGVPLFIEEVTRLLLESGQDGSARAIPPTLQQSLTARLDRLGPARELAQIGAVIGRSFSYGLIRAVAGMEDAPLQAALERLAEADILLVQGIPTDSEYRFRHALIQDVAYENLLKRRRQILHRRVAEALRDHFIATAEAEPELLAHHFTQAGVTEAAIEWWGKAGRHVTVMFCDLVDSTGIAAKLDADEWRDLVGAYLDAASAAVAEMGGKIAKNLGDGLMALFGYPVAQENDAERAVRAALAIQRSLAELNRKNEGTGKPALPARIAIDLGPVVVDATGGIFGDVPNIAARAKTLAEPGAVVVTARVQRQVAGLFVAEERGRHDLKGVPGPVTLYRIVRASGGGRRAGQRHLTPLVGREEELAILMQRWERARQGDGQLVLIVCEPGIGKSRLIEEFHSRLREVPHTWVEWSCSQLLQNTLLHPVAEWGRQRFGGAEVPAERRLADLENTLTLVKLDPPENIPLLAPLLDIPLSQERGSTLAPKELRRRQLAALTNWMFAGARVQPVVVAVEDLQWADPTTLDLLRGIAECGALAPLFIVATARPEFRPPWSMRSHHGTISLAPLDRSQVRDMVAELSARRALPRDAMEEVAARTGGVPLFVEEVTRLLLERGGEQGGITIPPTLQQSLTARLDRLGPAGEVAQIGAVIGRDFSYSLLRAVAEMADAPLQTALERLAEADILLVQGVSPESDYRFKHALIQDAAYENLLKSRRQVLHRRVAEILLDGFAAMAAAEPEALAHHFTQAGLTDAAIEWWGKAGDQALHRSAFQEAISHLGKAIEMADKASGESAPGAATGAASVSRRLKLQTAYGLAMTYSARRV